MPLIRKKVSTRLAAANRVNATKSTGPRTQRGKIQSSRNSVKFGIHSNPFLKRLRGLGEDTTEFEELHRMLVVALGPRDSFEQMLVEDMAVIRWRRVRLYSAEQEAWRKHQINTIRKLAGTLGREEQLSSESGESHWDEIVNEFLKNSHLRIKSSPSYYRNLSKPPTRPDALQSLAFALWQFRKDFAGFDEVGLMKLKTIYGPAPGVSGNTVLSHYESCLKEQATGGTQRKADQERLLTDLEREVSYYLQWTDTLFDARAEEREIATGTSRGGPRRTPDLSHDDLHAAYEHFEAIRLC